MTIRPTPQTTVEAVIWACRERGLGALHEADSIERLRRCDAAARDQINERLGKLFPDPEAVW
jgi:hypothetical protein